MIRNQYAIESIAMKDGEDANHVHFPFVDERLPIVRHFADNIAKMNVSDLPLPAVAVHSIVDIVLRHFSQSPDA